MIRLRFRLSTLMAVVLLAATVFSIGHLTGDIEVPLIAAGGLMILGVLGTATLGAIYRRGERRAFWVGFALFGWPLALVSMLLGLGESEFLFLVPTALPFGWIGGVIARKFAANPRDPVTAPPRQERDSISSAVLMENHESANCPATHSGPTSRSRSPIERR
jgi:hypothetical protein